MAKKIRLTKQNLELWYSMRPKSTHKATSSYLKKVLANKKHTFFDNKTYTSYTRKLDAQELKNIRSILKKYK
tara:strand:- start:4342 stop:4557 length:216 start_codon:yes stop_codon:yes gene_type:complete